MENSSNTSLERLLIIHLAQWYQSGEFAPLDTKQQSARFVHTGRHIQTVLTVQGAIDAFSKPWLYKEGIRRASFFFFFLCWAIHLSQKEGWSFIVLFNAKLCKDCNRNDSAHQCGNENWLRFSGCSISYVTQEAGDIPFGGGSASSELSAFIGRGGVNGM